MLQGGERESFDDCEPEAIASKLKVLLQMSLVLIFGSRQRVVRIGRIAGQYAKPRSSDTETRQAQTLPSYRGDLINRAEFSASSRRNDPQQLLRGYERSALTLNFIRALSEGGFADLHHPEYWKLVFVSQREEHQRYRQLCESLGQALDFIETIATQPVPEFKRVDFFTSHEALHCIMRGPDPEKRPRWMLVQHEHPSALDWRAHAVDEARRVIAWRAHPLGIKIGPTATPEQVVELVQVLNPENNRAASV